MGYTKNIWAIYNPELSDEDQPDAFITKEKLDHVEEGLEQVYNLVESIPTNLQADPEYSLAEDNKKEMVEEVLNTFKTVPYFNEEANVVAACGLHVFIEAAEEGKIKIAWNRDDKGNEEYIIVPEGVKVFGGGVSADRKEYYPATCITLNSGYVDLIGGGCYGNGCVGYATVIVNGGSFKQGVCGGGMHWGSKNAHDNNVGHAEVIINGFDGKATLLYGGNSSGVCTVGTTKLIFNDGDVDFLTAGGSNGYTGKAEVIVNGGNIKVLQGCNRGAVDNIKITVNGGTVERLYAGGETEDKSVTATYTKSEVILNGGDIKSATVGTNGGVVDATNVFGKYAENVITEDVANAMNLVKTYTIESLMEKISDLESIIS